jgi:hypothetical protein
MSTSRIRTSAPFSDLYDWRPKTFDLRLLPNLGGAGDGGGAGHGDDGGDGGDGDGAGAGAGAPQGGGSTAGHKPYSEMTAQERADHYGYPLDTRVRDMEPAQQAGYYKAKADKLEARERSSGLSPADLAALQEKAARADALEADLMTDAERAADEARKATTETEGQKWLGKVVAAEVRGQLRGMGITEAEDIADAMEYLDLGKLVNEKGDDVDPDRVSRALKRYGGPTGADSGNGTGRRGPSGSGLGNRTHSGGKPGDAGKAEAAKRFTAKTAQPQQQRVSAGQGTGLPYGF